MCWSPALKDPGQIQKKDGAANWGKIYLIKYIVRFEKNSVVGTEGEKRLNNFGWYVEMNELKRQVSETIFRCVGLQRLA